MPADDTTCPVHAGTTHLGRLDGVLASGSVSDSVVVIKPLNSITRGGGPDALFSVSEE